MNDFKNYKEKPIKKEKYDKSALTDNVRANEVFSPVYFLLVVLFLNQIGGFPLYQGAYFGSVGYAFFSTLIYIFASNYFQPDLDVMTNRPGMGHFPIGRWSQSWKIGRGLRFFLYPINRLWYYLWSPYSELLTHRGAGHWPIWGVWIRVSYLLLIVFIFETLLKQPAKNLTIIYFGLFLIWIIFKWLKLKWFNQPMKLQMIYGGKLAHWVFGWLLFAFIIGGMIWMQSQKIHPNISFFKEWLNSFFPWHKNFLNLYWMLFCFPIYLSDMVHIGVDFYDSKKRGLNFCPNKIPRGLISKVFKLIKGEGGV